LDSSDRYDEEALIRLERIGGSNLAARVIDAFLESAPGRIERARQGAATGDLEEIEAALHSLVSSAGQLGGRELERATLEGQKQIRDRGFGAAASVLVEVEAAFARFRAYLLESRKDAES
jgi:HPt (histidine-containing phosphotransfer) domain-containing protein